MRMTAGLLTVLCSGLLSRALAAEPTPAVSPAPAEPTAAQQQTAAAPEGEKTAPAGDSTAASPEPKLTVMVNGEKVEITREEQELLSRGYKIEMRRGQKWFCRRETQIGSHFETKSCNSADSIASQRATAEDTVRRMQANKPQINN